MVLIAIGISNEIDVYREFYQARLINLVFFLSIQIVLSWTEEDD